MLTVRLVACWVGILAALEAGAISIAPGDIIAVDGFLDAVFHVDPRSGAVTEISAGGLIQTSPGVAVSESREIFLADLDSGILAIDPLTGAQRSVSNGGLLVDPWGLEFDSDGSLLVTDVGAKALIRVDTSTGAQALVSSGGFLEFPKAIAVAPGDKLFVADSEAIFGATTKGAVIEIDPISGSQSLISSGGFFTSPSGVEWEEGGTLLVSNGRTSVGGGPTARAILRVDPATGVQTIVSSDGLFKDLSSLDLGEDGEIFVSDTGLGTPQGDGAIYRVDAATGAQTLIDTGSALETPRIALVPVPEPSTIVLVLSGLVCLRCWRGGRGAEVVA